MIAFLAKYNAHNAIVIEMGKTSYSMYSNRVDNKKNSLFLLPSMVDNQRY